MEIKDIFCIYLHFRQSSAVEIKFYLHIVKQKTLTFLTLNKVGKHQETESCVRWRLRIKSKAHVYWRGVRNYTKNLVFVENKRKEEFCVNYQNFVIKRLLHHF